MTSLNLSSIESISNEKESLKMKLKNIRLIERDLRMTQEKTIIPKLNKRRDEKKRSINSKELNQEQNTSCCFPSIENSSFNQIKKKSGEYQHFPPEIYGTKSSKGRIIGKFNTQTREEESKFEKFKEKGDLHKSMSKEVEDNSNKIQFYKNHFHIHQYLYSPSPFASDKTSSSSVPNNGSQIYSLLRKGSYKKMCSPNKDSSQNKEAENLNSDSGNFGRKKSSPSDRSVKTNPLESLNTLIHIQNKHYKFKPFFSSSVHEKEKEKEKQLKNEYHKVPRPYVSRDKTFHSVPLSTRGRKQSSYEDTHQLPYGHDNIGSHFLENALIEEENSPFIHQLRLAPVHQPKKESLNEISGWNDESSGGFDDINHFVNQSFVNSETKQKSVQKKHDLKQDDIQTNFHKLSANSGNMPFGRSHSPKNKERIMEEARFFLRKSKDICEDPSFEHNSRLSKIRKIFHAEKERSLRTVSPDRLYFENRSKGAQFKSLRFAYAAYQPKLNHKKREHSFSNLHNHHRLYPTPEPDSKYDELISKLINKKYSKSRPVHTTLPEIPQSQTSDSKSSEEKSNIESDPNLGGKNKFELTKSKLKQNMNKHIRNKESKKQDENGSPCKTEDKNRSPCRRINLERNRSEKMGERNKGIRNSESELREYKILKEDYNRRMKEEENVVCSPPLEDSLCPQSEYGAHEVVSNCKVVRCSDPHPTHATQHRRHEVHSEHKAHGEEERNTNLSKAYLTKSHGKGLSKRLHRKSKVRKHQISSPPLPQSSHNQSLCNYSQMENTPHVKSSSSAAHHDVLPLPNLSHLKSISPNKSHPLPHQACLLQPLIHHHKSNPSDQCDQDSRANQVIQAYTNQNQRNRILINIFQKNQSSQNPRILLS